jgi:hypothetical protein
LEQKLQKHDQSGDQESRNDAWKGYHLKRREMMAMLEPICSKIANLRARKTELEKILFEKAQNASFARKDIEKLRKFIGSRMNVVLKIRSRRLGSIWLQRH